MNTRVAIYVRVSTQEQAKEGYSIGEQTERLKIYASIHDWTVVKIYTDAGHSGASVNRPALQDLIHDVKSGLIDKVVVYKLDRLSRSQKDTLTLVEDIMLKNGCDFESITEKFDTATPLGKAMIGILAVFAQLEREQIRERLTMGMEARIKEGKWKGGAHVPFGYEYDGEKLVINEPKAAIIRKMFSDFNAGVPITTIANRLTDQGVRLNHGARISRTQARYILKNKTYCGYLRMNDQWIKGLHDPIISEAEFEKAQIVLDANFKRFKDSHIRTGYGQISSNLGGILFCGQCGAKYAKAISGTKGYGAGLHYNYVCYSRNKRHKTMVKDPDCHNKIWKMEELDALIFGEIKKLAIDPDYIKQIRQDRRPDDTADLLKNQIKQINKQLDRYLDLYGSGIYGMEEINAKAAPLNEQKMQLLAQLEKLAAEKPAVVQDPVVMAQSLEDALDHGSLEDRRKIILALINKIVLDGEDVIIHWNI